jgi:hypothetical protein
VGRFRVLRPPPERRLRERRDGLDAERRREGRRWERALLRQRHRLDSRSLLLPAGSSAYSGTVCFALGDWHLRLLMRNVGSPTGSLRVQVIVPSLVGGLLTVLDGGMVKGSGAWSPSPRLALALSNVTSLLGTRAVAFRFTPVGAGAAYQLDDVYLDPWKGT